MTQPPDVILRETDIRPDYLMQGQAERFAADVRRLLRHKAEFVRVLCPACGSDEARPAFEKYDLTYVACSRCETIYTNPRPTPAILERYYATSENYAYWNKYIFPASENVRREKIFRPRAERLVEICRRHDVATRVLLEVGAGFGTFCEEIQRRGLFQQVLAVEPTPDLAETCRRRGLHVIERPIEHVHLQRDLVNVIASFETIEHLFSPRDFLCHCAAVLSPGGLIIVTCPNIKGFDLVVLRDVSDMVDVEHLNYFHPASLAHLMTECGFEVVETLTPGQLDAELVRNKIIAGEFSLAAQPFLQQVLIDGWERLGYAFQRFLAENQLSSHMWLVARKK